MKALGSDTKYKYDKPNAKLLETFESPFNENCGCTIEIVATEFTSLCPKTGQPDFGTIRIEYEPSAKCVESKSLKLYLGSYRMHGAFHEACVNQIATDLINILEPTQIKVTGEFMRRGGIKFWPTVNWHS